jgi:hypothetical protein
MTRDEDAGAGSRPGGPGSPPGPAGGTSRPPEAPRPKLRAGDIQPHPPKAPRFDPWDLPVTHPGGARGWETRAPHR